MGETCESDGMSLFDYVLLYEKRNFFPNVIKVPNQLSWVNQKIIMVGLAKSDEPLTERVDPYWRDTQLLVLKE